MNRLEAYAVAHSDVPQLSFELDQSETRFLGLLRKVGKCIDTGNPIEKRLFDAMLDWFCTEEQLNIKTFHNGSFHSSCLINRAINVGFDVSLFITQGDAQYCLKQLKNFTFTNEVASKIVASYFSRESSTELNQQLANCYAAYVSVVETVATTGGTGIAICW